MRPILCTHKVDECDHAALNPVASLAEGRKWNRKWRLRNNFASWFICTDWFEEHTDCITITHIWVQTRCELILIDLVGNQGLILLSFNEGSVMLLRITAWVTWWAVQHQHGKMQKLVWNSASESCCWIYKLGNSLILILIRSRDLQNEMWHNQTQQGGVVNGN